jgi:hypothetical protein
MQLSPGDVLGWSMGRMTAQILAISHSELERPTPVIDLIRADV